MTVEEALERAEQLLFKIEALREQLEGTEDAEKAVEIIGEVSQLAKEVEAELQRAKRDADARPR